MQFTDWLKISLEVFPNILMVDALRYLISASSVFVLFYIVGRRWFMHRKIQAGDPGWPQIRREISHSLFSVLVFALTGLGVFWMIRRGITQVYTDIAELGILYVPFSVGLALCFHDAYFYWTHRLLHTRLLYRHVHRIHHLSTAPSPWAAYAFHPVEALIQGLIVPVMVVVYPIHPAALVAFLAIQIVRNVLGHSGIEMFPQSFANSPFLRLFQSNTEHDLHHRFTHGNYGLYFTWWDRMLGTDRTDSMKVFREVTGGDGRPDLKEMTA